MFTGLVEAMGRIRRVQPAGGDKRLVIESPFAGELALGESVAVQGICLSVTEFDRQTFVVTAVAETLRRTSLGHSRPGVPVNLERSLRLSDRLGGHLVTGHIDGVGRVERTRGQAGERVLEVGIDETFAPLVVAKGSVAIDGVSLTIVEAGRRHFSVALIPHTCEVTTLGALSPGDAVNLEFDLVAKYLLRFNQFDPVQIGAMVGEEKLRV